LEELFSTVANVVKVKLVFDPSGRSTGVAVVKYNSIDDAERAIKKYNNVELDGQAMKIELKEYVPRRQEG
jgi:RNA recognition motif-containing protein